MLPEKDKQDLESNLTEKELQEALGGKQKYTRLRWDTLWILQEVLVIALDRFIPSNDA